MASLPWMPRASMSASAWSMMPPISLGGDLVLDRDRVDDGDAAGEAEVPLGRHERGDLGGRVDAHRGARGRCTREKNDGNSSVPYGDDRHAEGLERLEGEADVEDATSRRRETTATSVVRQLGEVGADVEGLLRRRGARRRGRR